MVQAITQNSTMDTNIQDMDAKIEKTKRDTLFLEHIYKPYLQSELAYYVLMHEQWLLLPGEKIIKLEQKKSSDTPVQEDKKNMQEVRSLPTLAPHEAWEIFFQQLREKNF
jgi:hypothetical protein